MPEIKGNFKNRQIDRPETVQEKYERMINEYKDLLSDKIHPANRTNAYDTNVKSILNRLMVAADELDGENPGAGVFGLIILALRANLALKDRNLELEVQMRNLEKRIKKLEQR